MQMPPWLSFLVLAIGIALLIAGSVMLGVGISRNNSSKNCDFTTTTKTSSTKTMPTAKSVVDPEVISQLIQNHIDPDQIKQNLRDFTAQLHMAGTASNAKVADLIVSKWTAAGLENVHKVEYNVLLSYPPDQSNLNYMTIQSPDGRIVYKSEGLSPSIITAEQNNPDAGIHWLAFSPSGTVTGDVVYCGFATEKEFQILQGRGISLNGRIALIRYGGTFRGDRVSMAQKYGAIGAILYSDPAEVAPEGTGAGDVYPNTVYMPAHSVQRGTLHTGRTGDVLTPLYPSKPGLWRAGSVEQARQNGELPSIPVLPISYTSALELISLLDGPAAPSNWNGGLKTIYNLGPGLKGGLTTKLTVHGSFEQRQIQNVIGYVKGAEEPERYVILGNHYDAWTYGAMDPNAGTAVLAEVARATVQGMRETGWRPARSLMFAAWDAEEYGLVGSTEFVEEFAEILTRRAVAYINMDCFKGNQTIYVQSSPSLQDQAVLASKRVRNPRKDEIIAGFPTVYDTWLSQMPDREYPGIPSVPIPTGGSDQKAFMVYLGVPSVNFAWIDMDKHRTYPLYHTLYETPFTSEHLMDVDNFAIHRAIGQYWIELAVQLADAPTVPYSLSTLSTKLVQDYLPSLEESIIWMNMTTYTRDGYQQLLQMASTASNLLDICRHQEATSMSKQIDPLIRSRYNDKLINFERCFVNPRGTADDPTARHVLFSISKTDSYSGDVMQQIYKVIDEIATATVADQLSALGKELANQISIVHNSLLCAAAVFANDQI